jgi:two-component system, OmpR family, response regulator ArlR
MLTAKAEATDVVLGLELGADDYVTKPFSLVVLLARVRRILQKRVDHSFDRNTINIHDLTIDPVIGKYYVSITSIERKSYEAIRQNSLSIFCCCVSICRL